MRALKYIPWHLRGIISYAHVQKYENKKYICRNTQLCKEERIKTKESDFFFFLFMEAWLSVLY